MLDRKKLIKLLLQSSEETAEVPKELAVFGESQKLVDLRLCAKQIDSLQSLQKELSRKIGEAKQSGENAAPLLIEIKQASADLKNQTSALKALEEELYAEYQSKFEQKYDVSRSLERNFDIDVARLEVILCSSQASDKWNAYVDQHPQASIYHRYDTLELIHRCYRHRVFGLMAHIDGNVVGILPMVRQSSKLFGTFMTSMPFFNYGGVLADNDDVAAIILREASLLAKEKGCRYAEFRDVAPYPNWPSSDRKVCMILDLPETEESLHHLLGSKVRAQINRANGEQVKCHFGGEELLDQFYAVFAQNMRDLGTPVYSKRFFRAVLDAYGKQCRVAVLHLNGRAVSAAILIGYRDRLEIPWASTLKWGNKFSINMRFYWEVLCYAIRNQYKQFDFGRSTVGEGTYRFKKQWKSRAMPCYWNYWLDDGEELPSLNPSNPKFTLMVAIWKRLPVLVANFLGPSVVKYLP